MKPNASEHLSIEIVNEKEHLDLLTSLTDATQNKIVLAGMRQAAQIILQQAKTNFKNSKKNKSRTGYKDFNKSFKTLPMGKTFGLRVGVMNFKYKWLEWGTDDRSYKKGVKRNDWRKRKDKSDGHFTGKVQPTKFFYSAVETKKTEAQSKVSQSIIDSLNKTVSKYAKN